MVPETWDVPNLFVCDGSVFVTSSAVNPSLTIQALAARTARYIPDRAHSGELLRRPTPQRSGDAAADALRAPPTGSRTGWSTRK
jgi:choline dehydrogenase-like flavoprotein